MMNRPVLTDHYCYTPPHEHGFLSDHTTAVIIFLAFTAMALATILAIHMQDFNRLRRERDELKEALKDNNV